jgi:hypothetical protein
VAIPRLGEDRLRCLGGFGLGAAGELAERRGGDEGLGLLGGELQQGFGVESFVIDLVVWQEQEVFGADHQLDPGLPGFTRPARP